MFHENVFDFFYIIRYDFFKDKPMIGRSNILAAQREQGMVEALSLSDMQMDP